jgi:hypothetical protein
VAGELVAGLRVVFATFTKDVGANVQSLKYRDPTGHMKKTPEQEAVEEGAVGGVNNIEIEREVSKNKPLLSSLSLPV